MIRALADDSKVSQTVKHDSDTMYLQETMHKIYDWESSNNMKFNIDKLNLIQFWQNKDEKFNYNYVETDCIDVISQTEEVRDLGVYISPNGLLEKHISKSISKVNQGVGYFLKLSETDPLTLWGLVGNVMSNQ